MDPTPITVLMVVAQMGARCSRRRPLRLEEGIVKPMPNKGGDDDMTGHEARPPGLLGQKSKGWRVAGRWRRSAQPAQAKRSTTSMAAITMPALDKFLRRRPPGRWPVSRRQTMLGRGRRRPLARAASGGREHDCQLPASSILTDGGAEYFSKGVFSQVAALTSAGMGRCRLSSAEHGW